MAETAATLPQSQGAASRAGTFSFLLQVSRPGLWTTVALFYLMPLGRIHFLHSSIFWLGLFYVLLPLGFLLYGVNDIADVEVDLRNPRKGTFLFGSRGATEQLAALRWQIAVFQIPFLIPFFYFLGPRFLWWFAAMLAAVVLYNAPRIGLKSHAPFDVLIQASYLLIYVLSSWLNHLPQLPWQTFLFGALFAMHSHIFGEVMDLEPDRASGRRTTATLIGRVPAKLLIASLLAVESLLVWRYFGDVAIVCFLGLGALWFIMDASLFWKDRNYSPFEMRMFMLGWNAVAVAGMFWNWRNGSLTHLKYLLRPLG
jgi:4-hydroxybenzoate polyprenyltransferase